MIIAMKHIPPAMVTLQGTERSGINKLNIVNHLCMVTIVSQMVPGGSLKTKTTHFIRHMERVLSFSQGEIELGNLEVCRETICYIAKACVNCSSSARCHIRKSGSTGRDA